MGRGILGAMDIALVSDLHLEFAPWRAGRLPDDTLVIAPGDILPIGIGNAVEALARMFPRQRTLFVPGNHDYYNHGARLGTIGMADANAAWKAASKRTHGRVTALIDEVIDIDGIRFVGSPLFSDMAMANPVDRWFLEKDIIRYPDFRMIARESQKAWRVADMEARASEAKGFLTQAFAEIRAQSMTAVGITHFLPTPRSLSVQRDGRNNAYFATDLGDLLCDAVAWCHGHTHDRQDYVLPCGTRVCCNPRGYPSEGNVDFAPMLFSIPSSR